MLRIVDFLTNIEGRRWRALVGALLLLVGMTVLFAVGKGLLGLEAEARLEAWLTAQRIGPSGLAAAIAVFVTAAFLGVPQFLLIAACVVAFGPWVGFLYSWAATVASAAITYWLGRGPAARSLERFGSRTAQRMRRLIGANAFTASFVIRNVPSAPFVVVNMAFGAARANFSAYLAGCALGVLPKIALVAFFGGSFMSAAKGDGVWTSAILTAVAGFWLLVMLGVRELVKRREAGPNPAVEGDEPC